jgi:hypothetical protein
MSGIESLNLTEDQAKELDSFLYDVKKNAFYRKDYEYKRFCLDAALKKKSLSSAYRQDLSNYWLNKADIKELSGLDLEQDNQLDEFSKLYVPVLLEISRAINRLVGNICFPLNGDVVGIDRTYSKFCEENGIGEFLPTLNKCIQKILERENANFNFKDVYKSVLHEGLQHSFWALGHEYDTINHVVDVFAPGVQSVGVFPTCADWRKTNRVFVSDRNYSELFGREDLDRNIIEKIKPQTAVNQTSTDFYKQKTSPNSGSMADVPFGQVRLLSIFCPSVYLEGKAGGEPVVIKGLHVLAVENPMFKDNQGREQEGIKDKKVLILKSQIDVERDYHGLLLGTPLVSAPNEFYNEGLFYPWLDHQISANAINASNVRLSSYMSQGPLNAEVTRGGNLDSIEDDLEGGWRANQVLRGVRLTPVFGAEFTNCINVGNATIQNITSQIRGGIGVGQNINASLNTGRNGKEEVASVFRTGDLAVADYAISFIEKIQVPSFYTRLKVQGEILTSQVLSTLQETKGLLLAEDLEQNTNVQLDDNVIIETILDNNPLFQRLINYSGIKKEYALFYKKRKRDIIENEKIAIDILYAKQEVEQKMMFSQSPIAPLPPMPANIMRNELGQEIKQEVPREVEAQRQMEYFQQEQAKRQQAAKEVQYQIKDIELKELTLQPLSDIPPVSNLLLLQLIVEPIEESDIQMNGAKEALLKAIKDEDLGRFVQLLQVMTQIDPSVLKKYDASKLISFATRGNPDFVASLIEKDPEKILREEEADNQRAKIGTEMQMMMARNPGSQTPQNPMI